MTCAPTPAHRGRRREWPEVPDPVVFVRGLLSRGYVVSVIFDSLRQLAQQLGVSLTGLERGIDSLVWRGEVDIRRDRLRLKGEARSR